MLTFSAMSTTASQTLQTRRVSFIQVTTSSVAPNSSFRHSRMRNVFYFKPRPPQIIRHHQKMTLIHLQLSHRTRQMYRATNQKSTRTTHLPKNKSQKKGLTLIATQPTSTTSSIGPTTTKAKRALEETSANPPLNLIRAHLIMRRNQLRAKRPTAASPWSKT